MEEIFKQFLFTTSFESKDIKLQTILALHSVNVHNGLKLVGLKEEDIEEEYVGLPPDWDKHEAGVYSLKYKNNKQETFQFKFVTHSDSEWINIFAMKLSDNKRLCSYQLDTSKLKFDNTKELFNSQEVKTYEKEVLAIVKEEQQEAQKSQQQRTNILSEPQQPQGMFWNQQRNTNPVGNLPNFGRSDIDPFFRNQDPYQGGNQMGPGYFNNFQHQQQPTNPQNNPLIVPPGARFDPFGPDPNINPFNTFERKNNPQGGNPRGGGNNNFPF